MTAGIPVCCMTCGNRACVNRVTAGLRCRCGSTDVDLYDPADRAQTQHLAMLRVAQTSFADFMKGAASSPVGEEIPGWNVYTGPKPGPNPFHAPATPPVCPTCHGGKIDPQDGGTCRECGGEGKITPTTSVRPEPPVARHPGRSTQTTVPFMGRRKRATLPTGEDIIRQTTPDYTDKGQKKPPSTAPFSWNTTETHYPRADTMSPATRHRQERDYSQAPPGHFAMPGAACPNCGEDPTHLVKDHKEDAWWHCPNCGPLANIDKTPSVDPYNPPEGFLPSPKKFKQARVGAHRSKDRGSLLRMAQATQKANPGLTTAEVVFLARMAVSRYLEGS